MTDGAEEPAQYVFFGAGAATAGAANEEPAVTLSIAKRPGTNAIAVARAVLAEVDRLEGTAMPADVGVTITRHYGATATEKSNELLLHMAIAVVSVALLILFMLGWRESVVVAIAIPSTLGADAARVPPRRLHAEPHHPVRAHLLDRHPGRRRHRRRRERRAPPRPAREPAAPR